MNYFCASSKIGCNARIAVKFGNRENYFVTCCSRAPTVTLCQRFSTLPPIQNWRKNASKGFRIQRTMFCKGVRTIFCQGGGAVNHLPKNSRKLPKFLQSSRKETMISLQQHRPNVNNVLLPTYEMRTFLQMNLSYELIRHVKRNSCLFHFDGQRSVSFLTTELAYSLC